MNELRSSRWLGLVLLLLASGVDASPKRLEPVGTLHAWLTAEDESEPIWIEGEAFRLLLGAMEQVIHPEEAAALLRAAVGLRITRTDTHSVAELFLKREIDLNILSADPKATGALYRIRIPNYSRFELSGHPDGWIRVSGLSAERRSMKFYVRLPAFPDGVFFRDARLDLVTGSFEVVAGLLANTVAVKARGELFERSFEGLDFWDSLKLNFGRLGRPRFAFELFRL